jgi:hypothetical protein
MTCCPTPIINGDTCIKCGTVFYPANFVPYKKRSIDVSHAKKSYQDQKKYRFKICSNCLRETWNVGDNLCGACKAQVYNPVKGIYLEKGTEEYTAALIAYREKRWPEKFGKGIK